MGVTLEGHMMQGEMVARQGEQEAWCPEWWAVGGGRLGQWRGYGEDPFRCQIYTASTMPHLRFEKTAWGSQETM